MKIVDIYDKLAIVDMGENTRGHLFFDSINNFAYIFKKDGLIYEHLTNGNTTKIYQMNLKVKLYGHWRRILVNGLARQLKFALPRILARR
jgi:hypothetical protein